MELVVCLVIGGLAGWGTGVLARRARKSVAVGGIGQRTGALNPHNSPPGQEYVAREDRFVR